MRPNKARPKSRATRKAPQVEEKAFLTPEARRWLMWGALAAVIVMGVVLRTSNLGGVPTRSPDERIYLSYAARVAHGGLGAVPPLFQMYEGNSQMWSYPVPNRITYVLMVAAAMKMGFQDVAAGVAVSCLSSCLSLVLVAWIGIRFFNRWIALAAAAFLGCSLCELAMAQRAWQDAAFGFFGLLLLYVTLELARQPRRILWYPSFFGLGAFSLLTKQTGVVTYGLCAVWVLWTVLGKERSWKWTAVVVGGGLASIAITLGIWGALAGGVGTALSALNHSLHPEGAGRAYVDAVSTGPWYQFPYLLWLASPLTALTGLLGIAVAVRPSGLLRGVDRAPALPDMDAAACVTLLALGFVAFASFVPGMQNLRYICPANGAICLLAGLGIWYAMALARQALPGTGAQVVFVLGVLAVGIGAMRDYRAFTSVAASGMQDLPAAWVRQNMEQ